MNTISIRNATPEDASILAAAEREIARTPGRLASAPHELNDENFRDRIIALTKMDNAKYIVVEDQNGIVGHAIVEPHKLESTSHVVNLTIAIHEGHQGKGHGKKLMNYLIDWAKQNPKIEKFELHVRSSNTRAIQLYESLGFVEEGRKTKQIKYSPTNYQDNIYMAMWVG